MNAPASPSVVVGIAAPPWHETRPPSLRRNHDAILAGTLKYLLLLLLLLALVLPLLAILSQALFDHGHWAGLAPWRKLLGDRNFLNTVGRSIFVASATALLVVPLAYLFAYGLQRTLAPCKGLWRAIALLPLLAPSLLPGIALIYLFGNQGLFKEWMSGSIYGFWGILLGESFYTFPHALMILLSALSLADARLYDAAAAMGSNSWQTFRHVTLPATRYGIFGALCLVFTLTITDFGVPKIVGGAFNVLAVQAYIAVVGQQQFDRGALIGLLLLLPALLSFAVDGWLQRRQRAQMSSRAELLMPRRHWHRDIAYTLILALICAALLLMIAVAIGGGMTFVASIRTAIVMSGRSLASSRISQRDDPAPVSVCRHSTMDTRISPFTSSSSVSASQAAPAPRLEIF